VRRRVQALTALLLLAVTGAALYRRTLAGREGLPGDLVYLVRVPTTGEAFSDADQDRYDRALASGEILGEHSDPLVTSVCTTSADVCRMVLQDALSAGESAARCCVQICRIMQEDETEREHELSLPGLPARLERLRDVPIPELRRELE